MSTGEKIAAQLAALAIVIGHTSAECYMLAAQVVGGAEATEAQLKSLIEYIETH